MVKIKSYVEKILAKIKSYVYWALIFNPHPTTHFEIASENKINISSKSCSETDQNSYVLIKMLDTILLGRGGGWDCGSYG